MKIYIEVAHEFKMKLSENGGFKKQRTNSNEELN